MGQFGKLSVIEGGGGSPPDLLNLPSVVVARSPLSRNTIVGLRISSEGARKALLMNRRQPAFDLWAGVLGQAPPAVGVTPSLPGGQLAELRPVSTATACFRGLRRPVGDDVTGWDTFAYVHRVDYTFKYVPSMSRCVVLADIPPDLVFVTYAKFDYPLGRPCGPNAYPNGHVAGVITHWGFVEAGERDPSLPVDFETRYRKRMW